MWMGGSLWAAAVPSRPRGSSKVHLGDSVVVVEKDIQPILPKVPGHNGTGREDTVGIREVSSGKGRRGAQASRVDGPISIRVEGLPDE
jgi:hypothetical protein